MADLSHPPKTRAMRVDLHLLIFQAYLGLLIFDFRRSADDTSSLVVFLGLGNLALGLVLILKAGQLSRRSLAWMMPMIIFALATVINGILRGLAVYAVLSQVVPLVIFIVAVLVVANLPQRMLSKAIAAVAFFALLSCAWKLGFGFAYSGGDIETIRYQIISGALPLLFTFGMTGLLVEARRWSVTALALSLLIIALSVTRSYIVVFAASAFLALLAIPTSETAKLLRRGVGLAILVAITLVGIGLYFPETIERWVIRMEASSTTGFDLTGATRLAEASYQIQKLGEDTVGLLLGFGQGAETRFGGTAANLVRSVLGGEGIAYIGHGYGHVFYVGLIYVGGILFGMPVIATFLLLLIRSTLQVRRMWGRLLLKTRFCAIWGISSFGGYAAYGFLGGTWGDRSMSFYFGISFALVLICLRLSAAENRSASAPPPHGAVNAS